MVAIPTPSLPPLPPLPQHYHQNSITITTKWIVKLWKHLTSISPFSHFTSPSVTDSANAGVVTILSSFSEGGEGRRKRWGRRGRRKDGNKEDWQLIIASLLSLERGKWEERKREEREGEREGREKESGRREEREEREGKRGERGREGRREYLDKMWCGNSYNCRHHSIMKQERQCT